MNISLATKALPIIDIIVGVVTIIFRKQLARWGLKRLYKDARKKEKQQLDQIEDLGLKPFLSKCIQAIIIAVGLLFVVFGVQDLFAPDITQKYATSIFVLPILFIFATAGASLVMLRLVNPFVQRKVNRYLNEKYADLWLQSQGPSLKDRYVAFEALKQMDDTILQKLKKKASTYMVIWFAALIIVFLFVFYLLGLLIKATGQIS